MIPIFLKPPSLYTLLCLPQVIIYITSTTLISTATWHKNKQTKDQQLLINLHNKVTNTKKTSFELPSKLCLDFTTSTSCFLQTIIQTTIDCNANILYGLVYNKTLITTNCRTMEGQPLNSSKRKGIFKL